MAAARFWRVVAIEARASGDLELSEFHLHDSTGRIDTAATLTSNVAPTSGALASLSDASLATVCRFSAAQIAAGVVLQWDFGAGVTKDILFPRIGSAADSGAFIARGLLQSSADGAYWASVQSFGRVIWPGAGAYTALDPQFAYESSTIFDVASKGSTVNIISAKVADVGNSNGGFVRSNVTKASGKRVFGVRQLAWSGQQTFFAGIAALTGWGTYSTGKHWLTYLGQFLYYPTGTVLANAATVGGVPSANGDVQYYEVDFDAGSIRLKMNSGAWSSSIGLGANWVLGAEYVIDLQGPSSSSAYWRGEILTTATELAGHIPAGANPWDIQLGTNPFNEAEPNVSRLFPPLSRASDLNLAVPSVAQGLRAPVRRDYVNAGAGIITGTVKEKSTPSNIPLRRRVRLHEERSGLWLQETFSDAVTGNYAFAELNPAIKYTVTAWDHTNTYRAVIADNISPEVA